MSTLSDLKKLNAKGVIGLIGAIIGVAIIGYGCVLEHAPNEWIGYCVIGGVILLVSMIVVMNQDL